MAVTGLQANSFPHQRRCKKPVLLLDYDGTLAPFTVERSNALPYPGVMEALKEVLRTTKTQVTFISGRAARDLALLLGPYGLNCEIWGTHGRERLRPDGTYQEFQADRHTPSWLERTCQLLRFKGLNNLIELKPGSLAVHWMSNADRAQFKYVMAAAGQAATLDNPLAWLRLEPADNIAEVHLQLWPGSEDRLLARSGFHGKPVQWLGREN